MTYNRISTAVQLFLCLLSTSTAIDTCEDIGTLGTPSLDRFDGLVSMDVDADCDFTLKVSFKHDDTLPFPSDTVTQCNPQNTPREIASDGLPYFGFRWHHEKLSEDIKKATGIDHISIDWNSCGHPPFNIFTVPHYDVHFYRDTPEFRTCMTCDKMPGTAICDPTPGSQTTTNGLAFFNVSTIDDGDNPIIRNMPADYINGLDHNLPRMGGHAWDHRQQAASAKEWVDPIWTMGSYNGGIIHYQPMFPMTFYKGEFDKKFSENLSYEGQTITTLPSMFVVEYNGSTGTTTVTLKGSADKSYCKTDESKGASSFRNGIIPTFSIAFIVASLFL